MGVLEHAKSLGLYNTSFDTFGNGKLLQSPTPVTSLSISREALQKVLAEAIEPGIIKLNKKLTHAQEAADYVHLEFSDGTCETFDLVVGRRL